MSSLTAVRLNEKFFLAMKPEIYDLYVYNMENKNILQQSTNSSMKALDK